MNFFNLEDLNASKDPAPQSNDSTGGFGFGSMLSMSNLNGLKDGAPEEEDEAGSPSTQEDELKARSEDREQRKKEREVKAAEQKKAKTMTAKVSTSLPFGFNSNSFFDLQGMNGPAPVEPTEEVAPSAPAPAPAPPPAPAPTPAPAPRTQIQESDSVPESRDNVEVPVDGEVVCKLEKQLEMWKGRAGEMREKAKQQAELVKSLKKELSVAKANEGATGEGREGGEGGGGIVDMAEQKAEIDKLAGQVKEMEEEVEAMRKAKQASDAETVKQAEAVEAAHHREAAVLRAVGAALRRLRPKEQGGDGVTATEGEQGGQQQQQQPKHKQQNQQKQQQKQQKQKSEKDGEEGLSSVAGGALGSMMGGASSFFSFDGLKEGGQTQEGATDGENIEVVEDEDEQQEQQEQQEQLEQQEQQVCENETEDGSAWAELPVLVDELVSHHDTVACEWKSATAALQQKLQEQEGECKLVLASAEETKERLAQLEMELAKKEVQVTQSAESNPHDVSTEQVEQVGQVEVQAVLQQQQHKDMQEQLVQQEQKVGRLEKRIKAMREKERARQKGGGEGGTEGGVEAVEAAEAAEVEVAEGAETIVGGAQTRDGILGSKVQVLEAELAKQQAEAAAALQASSANVEVLVDTVRTLEAKLAAESVAEHSETGTEETLGADTEVGGDKEWKQQLEEQALKMAKLEKAKAKDEKQLETWKGRAGEMREKVKQHAELVKSLKKELSVAKANEGAKEEGRMLDETSVQKLQQLDVDARQTIDRLNPTALSEQSVADAQAQNLTSKMGAKDATPSAGFSSFFDLGGLQQPQAEAQGQETNANKPVRLPDELVERLGATQQQVLEQWQQTQKQLVGKQQEHEKEWTRAEESVVKAVQLQKELARLQELLRQKVCGRLFNTSGV
jgi:hypothetical protein